MSKKETEICKEGIKEQEKKSKRGFTLRVISPTKMAVKM